MADASVTIDEIAKLCGVTPRTVTQRIDRGELAAVRVDRRHVRIRSSELEAIVVARASAHHAEARNGPKCVPHAAPGRPLESARVEWADREEPRVSAVDREQTPPWIAIADSEERPPSIIIPDSEERPPSITDGDETLLAIEDDDETGLFERIFVRPDGAWRWTMFVVWPLLWLVAVLASVELGPLLH